MLSFLSAPLLRRAPNYEDQDIIVNVQYDRDADVDMAVEDNEGRPSFFSTSSNLSNLQSKFLCLENEVMNALGSELKLHIVGQDWYFRGECMTESAIIERIQMNDSFEILLVDFRGAKEYRVGSSQLEIDGRTVQARIQIPGEDICLALGHFECYELGRVESLERYGSIMCELQESQWLYAQLKLEDEPRQERDGARTVGYVFSLLPSSITEYHCF